jgi:hypothetical protein
MKRAVSGMFTAGALTFATSVGAQSGTPRTASQPVLGGDKTVAVTGCLARNADGGYLLNNARVDAVGPTSATTAGAAATAGGSTSATASGTSATVGSTATPPDATGGEATPDLTSWMLQGGTDLAKHVGHKIQAIGNSSWEAPKNRAGVPATGTGSPATGTATTTGAASPTTTGTTGTVDNGMSAHPRLDVQSIKVVSQSCS